MGELLSAQSSRVLPLLDIDNQYWINLSLLLFLVIWYNSMRLVSTDIYRCWHQWIVLFLLLLTWWEVEDRDWVWWRVIKSYPHKKVDVFYDRPYSTDLPYYVLSPSKIEYILKNNCGAFEQIVVDLQSGAQIRVLPLSGCIDNNTDPTCHCYHC